MQIDIKPEYLVVWVVGWAVIGALVTPQLYKRKGHPRSRGISIGILAGALAGIFLLLPLWIGLLVWLREPDDSDKDERDAIPPPPPAPDPPRLAILRALEAGAVGLFFVQAVRFVYATVYAHASSADLYQRVANPEAYSGAPGVIELTTVQNEIVGLIALMLLPLLALVIGRLRLSFPLAVILVAFGRSIALQVPDLEIIAGGLVIGAGLLYLSLTIVRRPNYFPVVLLLGFSAEQIIRALSDTNDYTWQSGYRVALPGGSDVQMDLLVSLAAILLILLAIVIWFVERGTRRTTSAPPVRGLLNIWGALALGGLLFLEFTLLSLPNAVARWAATDYAGIVPWLLAATALPLVPEVRNLARQFAGMFDGAWRGWIWVLMIGLLLVVGRRYDGVLAGVALVFAQFLVGLTLWWFIQTGHPRANLTPVAILIGIIGFLALAVGDYFTYDYAYVRDISDPNYRNVDELLRSFRGMGLGLALIAGLMLCTPMILARRRIPWRGGPTLYTFGSLALIVAASYVGVSTASETTIRRTANPNCLRAVTFNIHGGYSQFFDPNLEQVAQLVELNGADILLLQEVDTGRMASFGVDQVLWLSRRLGMEARFVAQNEALQGIAVLSRLPIVDSEGKLLTSEGNQAVAMRVVVDPEQVIADPFAPATGIHVYNVWLGFREAERDGRPVPEDDQDQAVQLNEVLAWINSRQQRDDRIILGGTFNFPDDPITSLQYRQLSELGIEDPFAGRQQTDTVYLVNGNSERYDYLWTFNLPLTGAMVDQSAEAANTSDHRSAIVAIKRRAADEGETELTCP